MSGCGDDPASILFDVEGDALQIDREGDVKLLAVRDAEAIGLLGEILTELRKMNMYLAHMTDGHIEDGDVT